MSRIRRTGSSTTSSVYGPPADTGADDTQTIIRDDYEIGTVGGRNGPSFSVGRVGMEVPSVVFPGKSAGTGVGVRGRMSFKKGGKVGSASKRADGCAIKGKTKGRMV